MGRAQNGRRLAKGITQQKDGLYCARYVDSHKKRKVKRSMQYNEVLLWLEEQKAFDDPNNWSDMTLDKWFEQWKEEKSASLKDSTITNYDTIYYTIISNELGNLELKNIKIAHCQRLVTKMIKAGYSSGTTTITKKLLHNILEYAVQNDALLYNPVTKNIKTKNKNYDNRKKLALTDEQLKRFLEIIDGNRCEYEFRFVLQTGLRVGELMGLKWSDICEDCTAIKIERQAHYTNGIWNEGTPKTENSKRMIPLTREAIHILELVKKDTNVPKDNKRDFRPQVGDYVFRRVRRESLNVSLTRMREQIGIDDGVTFSMHTLRRTFATRCIEGGITPKVLQSLMGHSSISVTMDLYVQAREEKKMEEIEKIDNYLSNY